MIWCNGRQMGWFIKENWPTQPVLIVLWWQTNTKPYGTGYYRPTQFPCKRVYHPHHRKSTKRFSRNPNHHLNSTHFAPWANQSFDDSFVFQGKRQTGGNNRQKEIPQYTLVGNAVPRNPRIAPSSSRWWSDPHSTPRKRNPSSRPRWQMTDDSF